MGDVTGPIRSLPGSGHHLPEGTMCDLHPDRPAVARIQGETDSFGCEMLDMCQQCLDKERAYRKSPKASTGTCDWCKKEATDLAPRRDIDEGSYGPVYEVCGSCRKRDEDNIKSELDRYAAEFDYGDEYDADFD